MLNQEVARISTSMVQLINNSVVVQTQYEEI